MILLRVGGLGLQDSRKIKTALKWKRNVFPKYFSKILFLKAQKKNKLKFDYRDIDNILLSGDKAFLGTSKTRERTNNLKLFFDETKFVCKGREREEEAMFCLGGP